jgi:segregation and condensation protein A
MSTSGVGYQIELDVFEGPLDLLLHLVKKHELDILDIPIAFITEKYLGYLDMMQALSLDVAGEYLLMAATLAHIKSRELLPHEPGRRHEEEEEGEGEEDEEDIDPREDLIRRLLEYQKYKEAAANLGQRPVMGRNVWGRGGSQEDALAENVSPDAIAPLAEIPVLKLIEALDRALRKAKIRLAHNVIVERLSVSQRISELTDRLEREASFSFLSCFRFLQEGVEMGANEVRHEAVVTFLAILEMAKLGIITVSQPEGEEDILIARRAENLRERVAETVVSTDEYR